jgi:hypothetical protein
MTVFLFVTLFFSYIYEDGDSLLVNNDALTICGSHQYAIKVRLENRGHLFVRNATGAPDSTGWLVLNAPLIVMTDSSSIYGSERGYKGGYMNSHPWGYGPGGGGAGGVSGGGGGGGAYGGDGGVGGDNSGGLGGSAYGNPYDTIVEMGSGGGAGRLSVVISTGGAGGAMVSLRGQRISIDSSYIEANGQNGETGAGLEASGGGAGGGIMIWADTVIMQDVSLLTDGGNGGDASFGGGGGAGGGRIKVFYASLLDTLNSVFSVQGGNAGTGTYGNPQPGMPGSLYIEQQTGIHEIVSGVNQILMIQPNPTQGIIHVRTARVPIEVRVYDCAGREVRTINLVTEDHIANLRGLKPGVYFLKSQEFGDLINKLIITR